MGGVSRPRIGWNEKAIKAITTAFSRKKPLKAIKSANVPTQTIKKSEEGGVGRWVDERGVQDRQMSWDRYNGGSTKGAIWVRIGPIFTKSPRFYHHSAYIYYLLAPFWVMVRVVRVVGGR